MTPDIPFKPDQPVIQPDTGPLDNSICTQAQPLTLSGGKVTVAGSTQGMQNEYGTAINCGDYSTIMSGPQAYYKVTLTAGQSYRLTLAPSYYYARFYIFTGCGMNTINTDCGSGGTTGNVSASISSGSSGSVIFTPTTTSTYYVAVDATNPNYGGAFTLTVETYSVPTNTTCAQAQALVMTGGTVTVSASTVGSTNEFGSQITCGGASSFAGPQVYYKITMIAGKTYRITLKPSYNYAVFYLFGTTCTAAAINAGCGSSGASGVVSSTIYAGQSGFMDFKPTVSGTYTIAVDSRYAQYSGNFELTVEDYIVPTNGTCTAAQTLTLSGGKATVTGTTSGVANEFGSQITCGNPSYYALDGPQVYYRVNLTANKTYKITLEPSFTAFFYIFGTTCTASTIEAACSSGGLSGDISNIVYTNYTGTHTFTPMTTGTYSIAVDSIDSYYQGSFTLTVEEYVVAGNGSCATAQAMSWVGGKATVTGDTTGVPNQFGSQITCGYPSSYAFDGPQVYYWLSLTQNKTYKITLTPDFYAALYHFGNTCTAPQIQSDCSSTGTSGDRVMAYANVSTSILFTLGIGGIHRFAVDSTGPNYAGSFTLTVEEHTVAANGTCATAQTVTVASSGTTTVTGDTLGVANEFGTAINCGSSVLLGAQLYYKASLTAGKTYTFKLTPSFNYARIYLFGSSCTAAQINTDCGSNGLTGAVSATSYSGNPVSITFKPSSSATYTFAVDSLTASAGGSFKVEITSQ